MADKNKIQIQIEADIKQLQSSLQTVEKSIQGLEKSTKSSMSNISDTFKSVAKGIGTAFAVDKIGEFTMATVQSASELNTLNAQYTQVLGGMEKQADEYLSGISEKYNKHPNELKQSFTQYNAMLKGKGMSEKDAYETSKQYLERTVDASAWGNMSMAESTEYFMAMIKGEYDSLDNAMVFTSQTMMNDKAQEVYGKKWEDLTVTQQENLKTSEALKQHMDSGVFDQAVREQNEYGNVVELTKAKVKELMSAMGTPIMDAITPVLKSIGDALSTDEVKEFATAIGETLGGAITGAVDIFNGFKDAISNTVNFLKENKTEAIALGLAVGTLALGIGAYVIAQNLLNIAVGLGTALWGAWNVVCGIATAVTTALGVAVAFLTSPFGIITMVILAVIAVGYLLVKNWETIKASAIAFGEAVKEAIVSAFQWVCDKAIEIWTNITTFLSGVWEGICNIVSFGVQLLGAIISGAIQIITIPFRMIWEVCKAIAIAVWDAIGGFIMGAISFIVNCIVTGLTWIWNFWSAVFTFIYNLVVTVFTGIWTCISTVLQIIFSMVTTIWNGILTVISAVCSFIFSIVSAIWHGIMAVIQTVLQIIFSMVSTIWNGIMTVISAICNAIMSVISAIWNSIKGVIQTVLQIIASMVSTVFSGMKTVITTISNAIKSVITTVWNIIKGVFTTVLNSIKTIVSNVFNNIKSSIDTVMNTIKGIITDAWDVITGIFNTVLKPNIKMPHFSISGGFSLNPPKVPSFGVDWYETGGIFTGASVVGIGENGDEAVLPLSNKRRMKPFAEAVASMMATEPKEDASNSGVVINVASLVVREEADVKRIAEELNKLQKRDNRKKGLV